MVPGLGENFEVGAEALKMSEEEMVTFTPVTSVTLTPPPLPLPAPQPQAQHTTSTVTLPEPEQLTSAIVTFDTDGMKVVEEGMGGEKKEENFDFYN